MTDTPGAPDPTPTASDDLMAGVAAMRAMNPDSLDVRMGIEIVEGAGHAPFWDDAPAFNERLHQFSARL